MPEHVKISEIISEKPLVIDIDDSVRKAALLMRENNISGLVVVEDKNAVAMITLKDIAKKVVAENLSPEYIKVRDIMSSRIITAGKEEIITEVAKIMAANSISRIPVLDEKGNLAGIITKTDILKIMPGLVNILYERENAEEIIPKPDRIMIEGVCEDCGNHSDELRKVDEKWICQECEELKNV